MTMTSKNAEDQSTSYYLEEQLDQHSTDGDRMSIARSVVCEARGTCEVQRQLNNNWAELTCGAGMQAHDNRSERRTAVGGGGARPRWRCARAETTGCGEP